MNDLQVFSNSEFGNIRTATIDSEPWFVGKDVAQALGYGNARDAIAKHVDSEDKAVIQKSQFATLEIPNRGLSIINESGVYALIFGSKLPSAKKFKRWVTSEVLPALRKTGRYETAKASQRALTKDDYLNAARIVAGCRNERLPYVLNLLRQTGIELPEIEQDEKPDDGVDLVKLSNLIKNSGISLSRLSELTNISKASLSYYRNAKYKPSPERYAILIQVLG